jgi:arginyl-tRNA synthetase
MSSYETIKQVLREIADGEVAFSLSQPEDPTHGDYATNIAFPLSKVRGLSPKVCAEELVATLLEKLDDTVEKIEVAGPGFLNFFLHDDVRTDEVEEVASHGILRPVLDEQALVEYTDPNCFKVFHIGHLMANAIGESLSRIYEMKGYDVTRVCYPSDIGRNVAMGVWGVMQKASEKPTQNASLKDKVTFLGKCYAYANEQFETNEEAKKGIIEVNKAIYGATDVKVMEVYAEGRALSLEYFDDLYKKLGTTFDAFIYESEVSDTGLAIVKEYLAKGVFEESEGAIVYKGEQDGLHTRVFVNKEGLPTYEAKDLGNYEKKLELVPHASHYVVITAKEQDEYFKVINKVSEKIHTDLVGKLTHIGHGMMRLPSGKMSSRTGNVIGGEDLLEMIAETIREKVKEMRVEDTEKEQLVNDIAVGAIKFSILKIAPGKDIAFDFEKSISFEGDSGPYLQYTHARLCALLDNASSKEIDFEHGYVVTTPERELEKVIVGYQVVLEKAYSDLGPHHIVQHLLLLTRTFNSMYARVQIVNENDIDGSRYYVMLAEATKNILAHGLSVLGMVAPKRM